jgi:dipeptide/tripeptide permease
MFRTSPVDAFAITLLGIGFLGLASAWSIWAGPPGQSPMSLLAGSLVAIVAGSLMMTAARPAESGEPSDTF